MNLKIGNPMKIIWSDFGLTTLIEIYKYYKDVANKDIAIKSRIVFFLRPNN